MPTRIVWIAFLAKADRNGFVAASHQGMCHVSNVPKDDFDNAIKVLESPDNDSRSPEYEGRRIEKVDGGWLILNYKKYREYSYSSNPDAERQRKHRKSVTKRDMSQKSCDISASASASVISCIVEPPDWYLNFDIYKKNAMDAAISLVTNEKWVSERQRYKPNLNIKLSVEKAFKDYWGTDDGWTNKKKACKKKNGEYGKINWNQTYTRALDNTMNRVFK
jgi:hypothetical protein